MIYSSGKFRLLYLVSMIFIANFLDVYGEDFQEFHAFSGTASSETIPTNGKINRVPTGNEDAAYWKRQGQQKLLDELHKPRINNQAKNVILFLGDGMSIPTVTATRIYKGQKAGKPGEEEHLSFDQFPYVALSKTYCVDAQVADSACTATAIFCGVKTNIGTIGIDSSHVEYKNCATQNNPSTHVDSIMDWAQTANKGTGIVTTTTITHATPAGTYAHTANRDWEDDYAQSLDKVDSETCDDIAEQLVYKRTGKNFKVIMGGGRAYFMPRTSKDPKTGSSGRRLDGKDLTKQWLADHPNGAYVTDRDELLKLDIATTDSILGLFSPIHMPYFLNATSAGNPTLEQMTRTSIQILEKEANGYVLLVEGGRIDHGHHQGKAKFALEEAYQFDLAIAAALNMTSSADTLIIVTSDHSHTMSITAYPNRGNDILGLVGDLALDGKPRTTLTYANGPGYLTSFTGGLTGGERVDLTHVNTTSDTFMQPAAVPLEYESHAGEEVAIFASGPQAHLFQGVYEQNYIAHVIGYAACIGPGAKFCDVNGRN